MNSTDVHRLTDEIAASDVVVVGSGVAGLSAALGLESAGHSVTLLTKTDLGNGSSLWAQGGVAAAVGDDDSPNWHAQDTLEAAAGLGEEAVIAALTGEGPERIRKLIELGGRFDRGPEGELALGKEGAHSRRRILHADGDATGREMVRALRAAVLERPGIQVYERAFALDLVLTDGRVVGVLADHPLPGAPEGACGCRVFHRAPAVVLATGGFGQLFERTTNPVEATGDGLAMAARAGAVLADLEFVQFHPTALAAAEDPSPLVTEALRGEGAVLINDLGERFMVGVDGRAELAPRDIVARAILAQQQAGRQVFLDAIEAVGAAFPERFPTVWVHCQRHGVDPRVEPIPVTPAAHYAMAGIAVDTRGRASLPGLWACGEVTSTGVHGANRLASNSLLEALVFGARVADDIHERPLPPARPRPTRPEVVWRESARLAPVEDLDPEALRSRVRQILWQEVGLLRDRAGLEQALAELDSLTTPGLPAVSRATALRTAETGNLLTLGRLVTAAALAREESRGAHFRADFAERRPELARRAFWCYRPQEDKFPLVAAERPEAESTAREIA